LLDLDRSDPWAAQPKFEEALACDPTNARAAFGLALTQLILLPEISEAEELLTYLGRTPMSSTIVAGEQSVFAGLRDGWSCTQAEDALASALPWDHVPAAKELFEAMPDAATGDGAMQRILALIPRLDAIADNLSIAIADEAFVLGIPRGLIYLEGPDFEVTVAEALLVRSAVQITRGALLFASAYDWN
jgi:hypothetical protein